MSLFNLQAFGQTRVRYGGAWPVQEGTQNRVLQQRTSLSSLNEEASKRQGQLCYEGQGQLSWAHATPANSPVKDRASSFRAGKGQGLLSCALQLARPLYFLAPCSAHLLWWRWKQNSFVFYKQHLSCFLPYIHRWNYMFTSYFGIIMTCSVLKLWFPMTINALWKTVNYSMTMLLTPYFFKAMKNNGSQTPSDHDECPM